MRKIWFNHWFSTAYNIINMIKKGEGDFYFIGTNENPKSVIESVCDEWYTEPKLKDDAYVDFCLDFCDKYKIDLFVPRREMLNISRRKSEFESVGTKVMLDDFPIVSCLNSKDKAYSYMLENGIKNIPEYRIVTTVNEFMDAYNDLITRYKNVCFKFVHDEGGKSFRLIDNSRKGYAALFKKQNTRMTLKDVIDALSERENFSPLMVMPNLSGDEISVDCLNTKQGLIVLPRVKDSTRIERLCFDKDIISRTKQIYDLINLECPCNIQFKYLNGIPYFLEVNTRMSGGVQMACLASGVNLPNIAVNKMFGIYKDWHICKSEKYVTHVEFPVVL